MDTPRKTWPETVGPYRVDRPLGAGGMGKVFCGFDERLDRPVALKRIRADTGNPQLRERFRREARAVARLRHSSIVQVYDIVDTPEGDWIVMEMIEGHSLREELRSAPLAPGEALGIVRKVTRALAAAHANGIVHRDLKADNVMLAVDGQVKVLDFGLAKRVWEDEASLTEDGAIVGTVAAMSPEQTLGEEVDQRSDFFALGTLLYEMLTGVAPFRGSGRAEILKQIVEHQPAPVHELNPQVSPSFSELVDRLLQKQREQRPHDALEVLKALDAVAQELSWSDSYPEPEDDEPSSERWSRSSPRLSRSGAWSAVSHSRESLLSTSRTDVAIRTVLLSDLVRSTDLVARLGDELASEVFASHDRIARDLLLRYAGKEIDKSDGFLMIFDRPSDAVEWALAYHEELRLLSEEVGVSLTARTGLHLGEIFVRQNSPDDVARGAKPLEVEGLAKSIAARVMSLAEGGQTLVTQAAFELAQRALSPTDAEDGLRWLHHGPYELQGVDKPLQVFEVGRPGTAPLKAPRSVRKARRVRRHLWLVAALVVVALLAAAYFSWVKSRSAARPSVAVVGFTNLSGDPKVAWIGTALAELITVELGAGEDLRLVPGANVERMKLDLGISESETFDAEALAAIGGNLGTDYVVVGSYLVLGQGAAQQLTIQPAVQSTLSSEVLVSVRETGTGTDLVDLVARAGTSLRTTLGAGMLTPQQSAAMRATHSENPEAAQLYYQGLKKLRRYEAIEAKELLEKAVAADPGYALAHLALSKAWRTLGYSREAQESAREAFERRRGLSREATLLIEGRYYTTTGQWQEAAGVYGAVWRFFPDNLEYGLLLASVEDNGQSQKALLTLESLRQLPAPLNEDPRIDILEAGIAYSLSDYTRLLAAAEAGAARAEALGAKLAHARALRWQGVVYKARGENEKAEASLQRARDLYLSVGDTNGAADVMNISANLIKSRGQLDRSEAIHREALQIVSQTGNRRQIATLQTNLADTMHRRGDLRGAKALFEESLALAVDLGDRKREVTRIKHIAEVEIALGELTSAAEGLARAVKYAEEIDYGLVLLESCVSMGILLLKEGKLDEVEAWYERAEQENVRLESRELSLTIHSRRAELYLARGDLEKASQELDVVEEVLAELAADRSELLFLRSRLLREQGRGAEAVKLLEEARRGFEAQGLRDRTRLAAAALAEALLEAGESAAAQEMLPALREEGSISQSLEVQLAVAISAARVAMAGGGEPREACREVVDLAAEASTRGLERIAGRARATCLSP